MEKHYLSNITIISAYCIKCGSKLTENKVKDSHGNSFCNDFCRKDFWAEIRRDTDGLMSEWVGRFDWRK
jgi:hypothetical protein